MQQRNAPTVSIILPTYNERENIRIFIPQLAEIFKTVPYEIIVVDDSSPDGTADEVRKLMRQFLRLRLFVRLKKEGVGGALREGYQRSSGDIILSADADLAFAPADLLKLYIAIIDGADLAVGSRHSGASARNIPTIRGKIRYMISRAGNRLLRLAFHIPLEDFSMNCRAIRRSLWESFATKEASNFFFFEMIFLAHARGARIVNVPVMFSDRTHGASKISLSREIPKAFYKMFLFLVSRRRYRPEDNKKDLSSPPGKRSLQNDMS